MQKTKNKISEDGIVSILNHYSVRNISVRGNEVSFSCPFAEHPFGDRNPSSSINKNTGAWHCFGCGRSGNVTTFVSEMEGVSFAIAQRWIRDSFGDKFNSGVSPKQYLQNAIPKKPQREVVIPEESLNLFYVNWDLVWEEYSTKDYKGALSYLFTRNLSLQTIKNNDIGFDQASNRITFPIRNMAGGLVGIKGRAVKVGQKPKYKSIGDKDKIFYGFPTCKIHNYVYGIHNIEGDLVIVEGEIDCLYLRQIGYNAVALGGSEFTDKQKESILAKASSVILLLDKDEAGEKAERKIEKNLLPYVPVRVAKLDSGDPASNTENQIENTIKNAKSTLKTLIN